MSLKNEPELGKNFWFAMGLSMLVLVGYPYFLQKLSPQKPIPFAPTPPVAAQSATTAPAEISPNEQTLEQVPAHEIIEHNNGALLLRFSTLGGSLIDLKYQAEASKTHKKEQVEFFTNENETSFFPGTMGIRLANESADLSATTFRLKTKDLEKGRIEFEYEKPGEYRLTKTYLTKPGEAAFLLVVALKNLAREEKYFTPELIYGMNYGDASKEEKPFYEAFYAQEKVEGVHVGKIERSGFYSEKALRWAGMLKEYFVIAVKPDWKIVSAETKAQDGKMWSTLRMDPLSVRADEEVTRQFYVYAGPERYEDLKKTGAGFEDVFSRGLLGFPKVWLLLALKFLNGYIHNYGWSIILLTLLIKILFAPIMNISLDSQKRMKAIQPKLKALQERHKNSPEKQQKETMELFKRNRVNPAAGCLPMLIQMPVLMAMYRLLLEAIELRGAPFFGWMTDLSRPDHLVMLPFTIPFLNWNAINLLPFLMTASQYGFQKVMPQTASTPDQNAMVAIMPLFFGVICYNMPSGLVLYWFVQNLLSIGQYLIANRAPFSLHHEDQ